MTGQVLRIAWYRFRGTFSRRWGGYVALALLIGLVGGAAMAATTAGRRTYSSYPDYLEGTNPSDLLVVPQTNTYAPGLVKGLAGLPHVRSVQAGGPPTPPPPPPHAGGRDNPPTPQGGGGSPGGPVPPP